MHGKSWISYEETSFFLPFLYDCVRETTDALSLASSHDEKRMYKKIIEFN